MGDCCEDDDDRPIAVVLLIDVDALSATGRFGNVVLTVAPKNGSFNTAGEEPTMTFGVGAAPTRTVTAATFASRERCANRQLAPHVHRPARSCRQTLSFDSTVREPSIAAPLSGGGWLGPEEWAEGMSGCCCCWESNVTSQFASSSSAP